MTSTKSILKHATKITTHQVTMKQPQHNIFVSLSSHNVIKSRERESEKKNDKRERGREKVELNKLIYFNILSLWIAHRWSGRKGTKNILCSHEANQRELGKKWYTNKNDNNNNKATGKTWKPPKTYCSIHQQKVGNYTTQSISCDIWPIHVWYSSLCAQYTIF